MKKNSLIILLLVAFIFLSGASTVFAQKPTSDKLATASAIKTAEINYPLPYPGLLPDSPFYFLKDWRDRIIEKFIFDPMIGAQYHLHLADKRLAAGMFLINYGKPELGHKLMDEAAAKLLQATEEINSISGRKPETDEFRGRLSMAIAKHFEVLQSNIAKNPESSGLNSAWQRTAESYNRVRNLFEERLQKISGETQLQK